jgi:hypothetical protein
MAGYVATVDQWAKFEGAARPLLRDWGVQTLHAKQFHDTNAEFTGWSAQRKIDFTVAVYRQLRQHANRGISVSTRKDTYKRRKQQTGLAVNSSPYGFCFTLVLNALLREHSLRPMINKDGLTFILEAGNANDGDVQTTFANIKQRHHLTAQLHSLGFAEKNSSVALQVADFLAFHSRRYAEACEANRMSSEHDAAARSGEVRDLPPVPLLLRLIRSSMPHTSMIAVDFHGEPPEALLTTESPGS